MTSDKDSSNEYSVDADEGGGSHGDDGTGGRAAVAEREDPRFARTGNLSAKFLEMNKLNYPGVVLRGDSPVGHFAPVQKPSLPSLQREKNNEVFDQIQGLHFKLRNNHVERNTFQTIPSEPEIST